MSAWMPLVSVFVGAFNNRYKGLILWTIYLENWFEKMWKYELYWTLKCFFYPKSICFRDLNLIVENMNYWSPCNRPLMLLSVQHYVSLFTKIVWFGRHFYWKSFKENIVFFTNSSIDDIYLDLIVFYISVSRNCSDVKKE